MTFPSIIRHSYNAASSARGVGVIYERDGHSIPLRAVPSRFTPANTEEGRVVVMTDERDYIVLAADVHIGGELFEPQRGDKIDQDGEVYEVLPLDQDRAFRYSDPEKVVMRIHTRFKEEYGQ